MVSLIGLVPHGCQDVRDDQVEELRHVDDVQELGTVADVKPHPVSVGLQADGLETEELQEVGSITSSLLLILTLCLTTNERQTDTCSRTSNHSSLCNRSTNTSFYYYSYLLL